MFRRLRDIRHYGDNNKHSLKVLERLKTTLIFGLKQDTNICVPCSADVLLTHPSTRPDADSVAPYWRRLTSRFASIIINTPATGLYLGSVNTCWGTCGNNWCVTFFWEGEWYQSSIWLFLFIFLLPFIFIQIKAIVYLVLHKTMKEICHLPGNLDRK